MAQRRSRRPRLGRFRLARWLAPLCLIQFTMPAQAEPLVIVTHPGSPLQSISVEDAAALYLDQVRSLSELGPASPLDLDSRSMRERFYLSVTERSLIQIRAYWSKRVFTGKGRPPKAYSVDEIVSQVKANPRAVAYLPQSQIDGLKPLLVIPE